MNNLDPKKSSDQVKSITGIAHFLRFCWMEEYQIQVCALRIPYRVKSGDRLWQRGPERWGLLLSLCVCVCVYEGSQCWLADLTNIPMRQEWKGFTHIHWPWATSLSLSLSYKSLQALWTLLCCFRHEREFQKLSTGSGHWKLTAQVYTTTAILNIPLIHI